MIADLLAADLPPARLIRLPERPAHHHHALLRDLHFPTPARDGIPTRRTRNLARQHATILKQQDAGFPITSRRPGARRIVLRAHRRTRHRKKKYERDKPRPSAMNAA